MEGSFSAEMYVFGVEMGYSLPQPGQQVKHRRRQQKRAAAAGAHAPTGPVQSLAGPAMLNAV